MNKQLFKVNRYYKIIHMSYISLSSYYALFWASYKSLLGRVARYTRSSDFEMRLLDSTQYDGN